MKVRLPDKDTTGIDLTRTDYIELRDYFAAKAMQGMITYDLIDYLTNYENQVDDFCKLSYVIADKMLKSRKQ